MGKQRIKPNYRRRVLRLPDLDHCKLAVLNSLGSPASRRVYEYAIDQFIAWYCSEPRLAFNRVVVVRYRMYLESRALAANTINQQLHSKRTPLRTSQLLWRAGRAGAHIGALCEAIHRQQGEVGVRRILGVLSLAKKYGAAAVEQACTAYTYQGKVAVSLRLKQATGLEEEKTLFTPKDVLGEAAVLETRLRQAQSEPLAPIDLISCLVSDELARRGERLLESVFSGMARAIIHNSDYPSLAEARQAIDRYFKERNYHFTEFPKRAGGKIWGLERVPSEFSEGHNCKDPRY